MWGRVGVGGRCGGGLAFSKRIRKRVSVLNTLIQLRNIKILKFRNAGRQHLNLLLFIGNDW